MDPTAFDDESVVNISWVQMHWNVKKLELMHN